MTKKTYGQAVFEHHAKQLTLEDDVIEYRRLMENDVLDKIYKAIEQAKSHHLYTNRDFYIDLRWMVEHIGQAFKPIPIVKRACPTPTTQQTVMKYHHKSGVIEWLWTLPTPITYYGILNNLNKFLEDKETQQSAQFCHLHHSGELLKWVIKENGEKPDALITIKKDL